MTEAQSLIEITREAERLRDVERAAAAIFEWACDSSLRTGEIIDPTLDPLLLELFGALDMVSDLRRERRESTRWPKIDRESSEENTARHAGTFEPDGGL